MTHERTANIQAIHRLSDVPFRCLGGRSNSLLQLVGMKMVMSEENKARARERMRAYHDRKRQEQGLPPKDWAESLAPVATPEESPAIPALMLEIELDDNQLAALTLDSRCKGLSVHDTILAVINKAYGLINQ